MRWIVCLGEHLTNLPIKQLILQKLSEVQPDNSIVFSNFKQIKVAKVQEFWTYPEIAFDFLREESNWCFIVNGEPPISYEKHQNQITFVTDFFSKDFGQQWHDELVLTEAIKGATSEVDLLNAYHLAEVQAFGVKDNWFAYCRKTDKPFAYARYNKFTHIMTDEDSLIVRPDFKRIWVDTRPTVINFNDYTIIRETT